jgi:LPS sulfotransferase NodH
MIITIIAEPRSGSTNLANWFLSHKDFTVLFEPYNEKSYYHQIEPNPKKWKYFTKHLLIKEIYRPEIDFSELIEVSDKIIILHRENITEQTESWLNAKKTNNWDRKWVFKEEVIKNEEPIYFNRIKIGIKDNFLNGDYFNISYEELYYNNGFQRVVDYLNIEGVENVGFPYGQKYRVNIDKPISLI